MRITLLADSFLHDRSAVVNGTQVQLFHLASAFLKRGHEVHYVAATRDRTAVTERPEGMVFHWIERPTTVFSWCRDLGAYRSILDRIGPDAVYQRGRSHLTWIAAAWARDRRRPFVWGSNGEDSCTFWKATKRVRASDRAAWRKTLLYPVTALKDRLIHDGIRGATRVITQTRGQAAALRANFAKEGVVLPSTFPPPGGARAPRKEKSVLWLASLGHAKQPELFLRLAQRCRDLDGWRFLLGGGTRAAAYREALSREAARLPNVEMLGPVPFERSGECYARASLFVNTSRAEGDGLPNSFIQAWLHATPVLSLNHDPNGWIAEHGLGLCAAGDFERFVAGGRALMQGAGAEPGARCARFAEKTFAAEETIDAYLDLFARS